MENRYKPGWQRKSSQENSFSNHQGKQPAEKGAPQNSEHKTFQNFRDLKIWQLGKEIVVEVYKITRTLPDEEFHGLTAQMRKTAVSIPCHISEGYSRKTASDYPQRLMAAAGACAELETQIEIAVELNCLKSTICEALMEKTDYETRMLYKLIGKLSENDGRHPDSAGSPRNETNRQTSALVL